MVVGWSIWIWGVEKFVDKCGRSGDLLVGGAVEKWDGICGEYRRGDILSEYDDGVGAG
jgi:hypothetical protein